MSQVSTANASYQAKDGLWYSCYEDMCEANKQHNQRHLEKLGLGSSNPFLRRNMIGNARGGSLTNSESKRKLHTSTTTTTATTTDPLQPTRRSLRARKVPPPPMDPSGYYDDSGRLLKQARTFRTGVTSKLVHQQHQFTDEERQKLQNVPDWLEEMHHFLLRVPHGGGRRSNGSVCSNDNARSVMRQVQRLVAGVGITYQHWPEGIVFYPNTSVTLQMNLEEVYNQAVAFEQQYGRDKGNGWLLRHPIRKMELFQQYKLQELLQEGGEGGGEGDVGIDDKDKHEDAGDDKDEQQGQATST